MIRSHNHQPPALPGVDFPHQQVYSEDIYNEAIY